MKTLYTLVLALSLNIVCSGLCARADETIDSTGATASLVPVPDDIYWDEGFGSPVVPNPEISAMAFVGDSMFIAMDGRVLFFEPGLGRWLNLGVINSDKIFDMAWHQGRLFIAGGLQGIEGNDNIRSVAAWNGRSWDSLPGLDGRVYSLAFDGNGRLYAGGEFYVAGQQEKTNIAYWDGKSWSTVGDGLNAKVKTIAVYKNLLYAGGDFYGSGEKVMNYLAVWDTTIKTWAALNGELSSETLVKVSSIAVSPAGELFVAGLFDKAGDASAANIAMYDGTAWHALGTGTNDMINYIVMMDNNRLYAGGSFTSAGGQAATLLAQWDGAVWKPVSNDLGSGDYPSVTLLKLNEESELFVGGSFNQAGAVRCPGFVKWDGTRWADQFSVDGRNGTRSMIQCFTIDSENNFYAGGAFVQAGDLVISGIARWSGDSWQDMNRGIARPGCVYYMTAVGTDIYLSGWFMGADDSIPLNNLAIWEGKTRRWLPIGNGIDGSDYDLGPVAYDGKMFYFAGNFQEVDGIKSSFIIRRQNDQWLTMGGGVTGANASIEAVSVGSGGEVYVGGRFDKAGGAGINNIAVWDPASETWSALGEGVNGLVMSIVPQGDNIYVGGRFDKAGGAKASNFAVWNKSTKTWTSLADSINGTVYCLYPYMGDIYIGGSFFRADTAKASSIVKYSISSGEFSPLGSGLRYGLRTGQGRSIIAYKNKLYVGGLFSSAGTKFSSNFARWTNIPVGTGPEIPDLANIAITSSPNPASAYTIINLNLAVPGEISAGLFNSLGGMVMPVAAGYFEAGSHNIRLNTQGLESGVYYCRVVSGGSAATWKVVVVR